MKSKPGGIYCNTDTARRICGWERGKPTSGEHERHTLYRTKSGRFFVHSTGGADTGYGTSSARWGEAVTSERIDLVSDAEARRLVDKHATRDECRLFKALDDPDTRRKALELSSDALWELRELSRRQGATESTVVEGLIREAYRELTQATRL